MPELTAFAALMGPGGPGGMLGPGYQDKRLSRRGRRWLIAVCMLLSALLLGISIPWARHIMRYGAEFPPLESPVRVDSGDRFSLAVLDHGASSGDHWIMREPPAPSIAVLVHEDLVVSLFSRVGPDRSGCCGGTRYFTFDAGRPGNTTIELYNCFQGCDNPRTLQESTALHWDVEIE